MPRTNRSITVGVIAHHQGDVYRSAINLSGIIDITTKFLLRHRIQTCFELMEASTLEVGLIESPLV